MALPRIVVTGSSGFVGRHLLDAIKDYYRITGIARRSQLISGAPHHPNIEWHQADIADRATLAATFEQIRSGDPVDVVIHLAAHYDFTGQDDPEYQRTNIIGLRNVLEECRLLRPRRFVFSSSVAACEFPPPGAALDENSPADGTHIYARSKSAGEAMLAEYADAFPSTIVRFAAMFSDWCEYPPLWVFLETWLSSAWNRRILGGNGRSAVPYLHVRDGVAFLQAVLRKLDEPEPGAVLLASTNGCTSHRELYAASTEYDHAEPERPILMPRVLARVGMHARLALGRLLGRIPFERPWMASMIDLQLRVDASRSHELLGWSPRPRLEILRRLPFLVEYRKSRPVEWHRRNQAAIKKVDVRPNLAIYRLLLKHQTEIEINFTRALLARENSGRFPDYQRITLDNHKWNHRLIVRHMMESVRTRERALFLDYCRDLAVYRAKQGFDARQICDALVELGMIFKSTLHRDPEARKLQHHVEDQITTTIAFGRDRIQETFEQMAQRGKPALQSIKGKKRKKRLPRVVITGASGFLGRQLLELIKLRCRISGIGRRSQSACGAPVHPNIQWWQVDVGDRETLSYVFDLIGEEGEVDYVIHLAAHYDYTGVENADYRRTNVDGLRNVLECCKDLRPKRFIFGSSLAGCRFGRDDDPVNEDSPLDNDHIYARTKREGERMLAEYGEHFPSAIVRFAALFSDWCENPPVYMFLQQWLSGSWRARMLAGRGRSAIPYLHVEDAARFLDRVMERADELENGEVLIASPDHGVSHDDLYERSTGYYFGRVPRPVKLPKPLCRLGVPLVNLFGRLGGELPFERPWMVRYIDKRLDVDASRTRGRLAWEPNPRLKILRRVPLMIENLRADPIEWTRLNREAMKTAGMEDNLKIFWLLEKHSPDIERDFTLALIGSDTADRFPTYRNMGLDELDWHIRLILRHLGHTVRTRERGVLLSYCHDLAERRFRSGFTADEVCDALAELNLICLDHLRAECRELGIERSLELMVTMSLRFGTDQILERFELLQQDHARYGSGLVAGPAKR
jgi:nucleoside-diphosphate-sugar epimerase